MTSAIQLCWLCMVGVILPFKSYLLFAVVGTGLRAADLNGKSDPFCILQLANTRFHTQVEPKTLEPEWNRVFTFPVSDIHTALDITVMDMDLDKKSDFLGRVAIPLLKIHNKERRWYVLKDQKLQARTQGSILLEVELVYNPVRAAIRTLCEKDSSMDGASSKFDRRIFIRNVGRIRGALVPFLDWANCFQSCLSWESKQRSVTALIAYLFLVWFCEPWMVPVWFLFVFLLSYAKRQLLQDSHLHGENSEYEDDEWHFENETDLDHDPNGVGKANVVSQKTNFVAKVRRAQEQLANVQDVMGYGADLCERVQNTFRFVIPWLSYMGMSMLCVLAVILYVVPLRILLIIWGIAKFGKKLRNQHTHDSDELLDFFSRMHTNDEIRMYRELREFREKDYDHAGNGHAVNGKTDDHILKRTVSLQLHGSSVSHD